MTDYLAITLVGALLFILAILVLLLRRQRRLERSLRLLEERLQRSNEDVAGLCSAAVAVDRRLAANDSRLNSIADQITTTQRQPAPAATPNVSIPAPEGYENVIQKIRRGIGIDELVRDCGLTRDEAVLLTRLHGGK